MTLDELIELLKKKKKDQETKLQDEIDLKVIKKEDKQDVEKDSNSCS